MVYEFSARFSYKFDEPKITFEDEPCFGTLLKRIVTNYTNTENNVAKTV